MLNTPITLEQRDYGGTFDFATASRSKAVAALDDKLKADG
jgi:hypothetical protein